MTALAKLELWHIYLEKLLTQPLNFDRNIATRPQHAILCPHLYTSACAALRCRHIQTWLPRP
jgi:hypothetical protein